ncbi:MAG TPA: hypothetical protein VGB94_15105 [Acidobacteriaceae bacterium]
MLLRPLLLIPAIFFATHLPACAQAKSCKVVDLMPAYWSAVESSKTETPAQKVLTFRHALNLDHTDLYSATGIGFASTTDLDLAILTSMASVQRHDAAIHGIATRLRDELPAHMAAFQRTFPDFRCNFTIYLAPSLGKLDGAGRIVDGHPALVFGVDNISEEFSDSGLNLSVFLDHEIFHRYHEQVAGFSDDKGDQEQIGRALWAEGLATYISMKMNPPATLQDALFIPSDLIARAQPLLPSLIAQLEPKLDQADPELFHRFFSYHHYDTGVPSRSGYYIGALAAARMAEGNSMLDMAHMDGVVIQRRLPQILRELGAPAIPGEDGSKSKARTK